MLNDPSNQFSIAAGDELVRDSDGYPIQAKLSGEIRPVFPVYMSLAQGRPRIGQNVFARNIGGNWVAFGSYNQLMVVAYKEPGAAYVAGADPASPDPDGNDVFLYQDVLDLLTGSTLTLYDKLVIEWVSSAQFLYATQDDGFDTTYETGFYIPTWAECSES